MRNVKNTKWREERLNWQDVIRIELTGQWIANMHKKDGSC